MNNNVNFVIIQKYYAWKLKIVRYIINFTYKLILRYYLFIPWTNSHHFIVRWYNPQKLITIIWYKYILLL